MTIRRFDRGPTYMEENDSGSWVRYADHAAVLDSKLAEADKELSAVVDRLYRAERYVDGQDLRSDFRTASEMRAALEQVTKERDALLAEVRAWRNYNRWGMHTPDVVQAMDATDAVVGGANGAG